MDTIESNSCVVDCGKRKTNHMANSSSNSSNSSRNSLRKLHQRTRARIIHDKKDDDRIKRISFRSGRYSGHFIQTFLVIVTALLCTLCALLRSNPKLFHRLFKSNDIPAYYFTTRYPRDIILDRDLPRFFRWYSIATPENEFAQQAVVRVSQSRKALRRRAGKIKTILKAWDSSYVEHLLKQEACGNEFVSVYRSNRISQQRKDDLLMWCLTATRVTEGFFMESVQIIDSPLSLIRNRGIVVLKQTQFGGGVSMMDNDYVNDGHGAQLSRAMYLHPRTDKDEINLIPSKILAMLISIAKEQHYDEADDSIDLGQQELIQRLLYDAIISQGNENNFLILEEICSQKQRPERAVAIDITSDNCYYIVPEKYGGNFGV